MVKEYYMSNNDLLTTTVNKVWTLLHQTIIGRKLNEEYEWNDNEDLFLLGQHVLFLFLGQGVGGLFLECKKKKNDSKYLCKYYVKIKIIIKRRK